MNNKIKILMTSVYVILSSNAFAQQSDTILLAAGNLAPGNYTARQAIHVEAGTHITSQTHLYISSGSQRTTVPHTDSNRTTASVSHTINIYPNPTSQNINISIATAEHWVVYLFDNMGNIVLYTKQRNNESTISLDGFSAGVYNLKVIINNEQAFYKIMKL